MNDHIDTREGWREVTDRIRNTLDRVIPDLIEYGPNGVAQRCWVRESLLPTEPGYYVDADGCAWRLDTDGEWDDTFGNPLEEANGVSVKLPLTLYEPRYVTAKAVLDRVREERPDLTGAMHVVEQVAREFGVTS